MSRAPEESLFRVVILDGGQRLRFVGELDVSSLPDALLAIRATRGCPGTLVMDLTRLGFMDGTGADAIRLAAMEGSPSRRLVLLRPRPIVRRVLQLAGVETLSNVEFVSEPTGSFRFGPHIGERMTG